MNPIDLLRRIRASVESTEISDEEVRKIEILEIKEHLLMKSTERLKLVIMLNAHTKECLMVTGCRYFASKPIETEQYLEEGGQVKGLGVDAVIGMKKDDKKK